MKITNKIKAIIIIILLIIEIILVSIYASRNNNTSSKSSSFDINEINISNIPNSSYTISTTAQVESALSENLELHATYYLSETLVETNKEVKEGENILQYTNGSYLVAPYDCIVTSFNVPNSGEQCTNGHYVQISSLNTLKVTISVDETLIGNIEIGDEAQITITAYDVQVTGYVTKIGSIATQGRFSVEIEFSNSENIKLGMTAQVKL